MKRITLILAAAILVAFTSCTQRPTKLQNQQDTLSWALGRSIAEGLVQQSSPSLNKEIILEAVKATLDGKPQPLSDSIYMQAKILVRNQLMMEQQTAAMQQGRKASAEEEQAFANFEQKHPNAKRHESGFYYEVVKDGHGPQANYGDLVKFDYKGYNLITNQLVDITYGQREPIVHVVGQPMFPGLIYGIQLMNAGSIYRFYFPSKLFPGGSSSLPDGTPAIYEVELHEILK